jgi:predicted nucleic acid-binding protein
MVLLDTNILSEALRANPRPKVQAKLHLHSGNFAASVITLSELRFGAMIHPEPRQLWSKIETTLLPLVQWLTVDHAIALQAADLNADLRRKGKTVGPSDCLIAATALVHDLVLITRNTEHFKHMPGLQLENWFR